jgi:transcriptional regulator with XRE-family HTH domain
MTDEDVASPELPLIARRLDALFRTRLPKGGGGREYSYKEVEKAINDVAGPKSISHSYIWQLRTGKSANPTLRGLSLLAAFFSVPITYFFDNEEAERLASKLDLVDAFSDDLVLRIATRANGLSDASLTAILAIIENARTIEGLADATRTLDPEPADT